MHLGKKGEKKNCNLYAGDAAAAVIAANLSTKWQEKKRKPMENDDLYTVMYNNLHTLCVYLRCAIAKWISVPWKPF